MVKYRQQLTLSNLWVSSHDKLSDFYASSWQRGTSPAPLLLFRAALTVVAVAILAWSVSWSPRPHWLLYLTNWGVLLVTAMMINGLFVSFIAIAGKMPDADEIEGELPCYVSSYWLLFNLAASIAITITTLFWVLLYDPELHKEDPQMFWLDIATHGLNSCLVVAETIASRTPVRLLHIYQPLAFGLWYAAFTVIYYISGGIDANGFPYIYAILDWRESSRAGSMVGLAAMAVIAIYCILYGLALCRDQLSTILLRTTTVRLHTPPDV